MCSSLSCTRIECGSFCPLLPENPLGNQKSTSHATTEALLMRDALSERPAAETNAANQSGRAALRSDADEWILGDYVLMGQCQWKRDNERHE